MNVLVPISPTTRETIIRGVTAVGRLLGSGNWWTERAYAGALSRTGASSRYYGCS